ncbi:valyl-tRNA synthetase [Klebsiella pneumoniae]|uniref:valyl-tRNA synthetase n=1 Tax=Klebsiella pneumoniae TaxID=573 RepID=UPI000D7426FE|nr:valyl-tRNA synthetase [Klebsiella pneumoniae]PXI50478.1 valyl-tRNA synthetase [Klebsiella pneumoniae]
MTKSTITRERLVQLANFKGAPVTRQEEQELARMALAAMDSEPVAWMHNNNDIGIPAITTSQKIGQHWMAELKDVKLLYLHAQTAPVVPVVPEEWTIADAVKFCKETGRQDAGAAMDAWNACRAAMLAAAPQEVKGE